MLRSCLSLLVALPLAESLRVGHVITRRQMLSVAAACSTTLASSEAARATGNMPAVQGVVGNMDPSVKKAATPEAAKKQITAGYETLGTLFDDFDKVTGAGGGDGVRRYLGTVGTDSPIYLIEPAFRLLFDTDESLPMEYIEKVESLMQNLASAETEAYSAIVRNWDQEPRRRSLISCLTACRKRRLLLSLVGARSTPVLAVY